MATLYTYPGNPRAFRAIIAAKYSGVKLDVVDKPPEFVVGETNKSEKFLKKFPYGKVPALETADNQYIIESNAIAYYVSSEELRGKTPIDRAHVIQWMSFADNEILPAACAWVFPYLRIIEYNKEAIERAKEDIKRLLNFLNGHLLTRTYLVGERITLADIVVWSTLHNLYHHVLDPGFRSPYGNVTRWFNTLLNQPEFQSVSVGFKMCEQVAQFDTKPCAMHEKMEKGGKGKQKEPKPQKQKQEKKEKKEEKKEKEVKEDPDDDFEILGEPQPKPKDPFEKFPKGNFNMDDFKRVYSNQSETVSVPYFWEKFDKENYSIWFCEYKFPQELTMVFMSCNLISGMFQRLDKMRKNAFGSMILFGEDNNSTISGVWVWRGHELAFQLSEDWQVDYESYDWTKLDPDKEETKKVVNEYFSWSGDFGGKKFNQGKIFK